MRRRLVSTSRQHSCSNADEVVATWKLWKSGDRCAYEALAIYLDSHAEFVRAILRRFASRYPELVEEAMNESILKALHYYDPARNRSTTEGLLSFYILVCKSTIIRELKQEGAQIRGGGFQHVGYTEATTEELARAAIQAYDENQAARRAAWILEQGLSRIEEGQKEVLKWIFDEGRTVTELSQWGDQGSWPTVKDRVEKARACFRKQALGVLNCYHGLCD